MKHEIALKIVSLALQLCGMYADPAASEEEIAIVEGELLASVVDELLEINPLFDDAVLPVRLITEAQP